jgi:hypothetical protein
MPAARPQSTESSRGAARPGPSWPIYHCARTKREGAVLSSLNRRIAAWSLGMCFMTSISANAGLLPERVEKAAQERIAAGTYQTLVIGVVDGDKRA